MRHGALLVTAALMVPSAGGIGAPPGARWSAQGQTFRTVAAEKGDIASGVIVFESEREIRIKIDPCNDRDIIVFYAPFKKTRVGQTSCGSQVFEKFQLEKQ